MGKFDTNIDQKRLCRKLTRHATPIAWWNPRTWHKHAKSDGSGVTDAELHLSKDAPPDADAARNSRERERERQYNRAFIEKHTREIARRRGESAPDDDGDLEVALSYGKERAPPGYHAPSGYRAPPTMATGQIYVPSVS